MPAVINSGTAGELNPGFGGAGIAVTATAVTRTTQLVVTVGGVAVDALSAQTSYGWDQVAGEARVIIPAYTTEAIGDAVVITMNGEVRFRGTLRQFDTSMAPHAVTLLCKGPLYALEEWVNGTETIEADEGRPGLAFEDLVGAQTATLKTIVQAVFDRVGVTKADGTPYSAADLDNPSHVYGTDAPEEFTWQTHESAAAYLNRIFEASAGHRVFDSADGNVYLRQVNATADATPDFTLQLGVDILPDSRASYTSIGRKSAVLVEGYDDGDGPATSGIIGTGTNVFRVSSTLIETDAFATEIANFWLPQVSRAQKTYELVTGHQGLFGPAQTHELLAKDGSHIDYLWVQASTAEVMPNAQFTQSSKYVVAT